jgi:hypothetical protein
MRSLAEIEEILARTKHHFQDRYDIESLRRDLELGGERVEPFLDFVPIRLTTIVEHSVRGAVQQAVDHGEPFRATGIRMISKLSGKFVAEALAAVSQQKVTIGQLASLGFSVGNLAEILNTLETVFGANLREEFSVIQTKWTEPEKNIGRPIIDDLEETFSAMNRLLIVRHILVHERPRELPYSRADLDLFIKHSESFVDALHWIVVSTLYGSVPYTQTEMNIKAGAKAAELQGQLDALRGGSTETFAEPKSPLEEREYHWDKFCDLTAQNYAGYFDDGWPGTIAPLLYASAREAMTEWRLKNLKEFGSRWGPEDV